VGTFLSFFHQGSLGGLYGVLHGRPFAYRESLGIWPTTFFLFILSAAAVGPSFILFTTWLAEKITRKQLVRPNVYQVLGRVSGVLLGGYVVLKGIDTAVWLGQTTPRTGFAPAQYYAFRPFGAWILVLEFALFLVPAVILLLPKLRARKGLLLAAAAMACCGVTLNRFVLTIQTLALPTLSFDEFLNYMPSWQETGTFLAVVAYGVLVYSFSFRFFTLFPQERELRKETASRQSEPARTEQTPAMV
jgi:molybdopterin-containing oxidoreductase family membrane subunit